MSDSQSRILLEVPNTDTLKGLRDHASLATLLYRGMRRKALCRMRAL